jgi:hypothetical protein
MPAGTSISSIYSAMGSVVNRATGRSWWKKAGIQAQPPGTYATVFISEIDGIQNPVVSHIQYSAPIAVTGEIFKEIPWGTSTLDVQVEFWRSATNDAAIDAAQRFYRSLYLEKRWTDLWSICALSGSVRIVDISAMFRADIEPRVRVQFRINANLSAVDPLLDISIHDIGTQPILIEEGSGGEITLETDIAVDETGEITEWPIT